MDAQPTRFRTLKKDARSLIEALSSGPVRKYLIEHEHSSVQEVVLKNKEILGIPASQLFDQIAVRRKAREKLPLYYNTPNIIYPPRENFEQSSSEATARFKSEIAATLINLESSEGLDLTGGFGVDTYFLSRVMTQIHAVEPNQALTDIARFNHKLLGSTNINYHSMTAEEFVDSTSDQYAFALVDPSRRTMTGQRIVRFSDARPDIIQLAPRVLRVSRWLMIKASPLLDLQAGMSQIPNVRKVYVVSVSNECKEILFLCGNSSTSNPETVAVNILSDGSRQSFEFTTDEERTHNAVIGEPSVYLYEPNASILKAGAFKTIGVRYDLIKVHPNTHLYSSSQLIPDFPGRVFRIIAFVRPEHKEIRKYIEDNRASVATRNYPLSAPDLARKMGVTDGGEKFIIAFTGPRKKYVAIAERL